MELIDALEVQVPMDREQLLTVARECEPDHVLNRFVLKAAN